MAVDQTRLIFLLKDEIHNIPRSLPVAQAHFNVFNYDSGSTDGTLEFCRTHQMETISYHYVDHYTAYKEIIEGTPSDQYVIILDGDMILTPELIVELKQAIGEKKIRVGVAPILWYHCGVPIPHASMCPPKPILFRGGDTPFVQVGHCEKIAADIPVHFFSGKLLHDDRKPFARVMQNQVFYAEKMLARYEAGQGNWRDRIRAHAPWIIPLVFFKSYFLNCGFLDGKAGWLYAMDRVLVELLMYRCGLARRLTLTSHRGNLDSRNS